MWPGRAREYFPYSFKGRAPPGQATHVLASLRAAPPTKRSCPRGPREVRYRVATHAGVQLTLADVDGMRVTAFATNTRRGQLPDLELWHRRRARAEDRIRTCKDTGLTNLPLHSPLEGDIRIARTGGPVHCG